MKKLLFPLVALLILATSCTKDTYYFGSQVITHTYTVKPTEWMLNSTGNLADGYLFSTWENADITPDVFANGTVQAYVYNVYDVRNQLGAWNTLPYVYPLALDDVDGNGDPIVVVVPENIRFEWEQGKVTFIIQDLDGYDPTAMTGNITFKVCVTRNM